MSDGMFEGYVTVLEAARRLGKSPSMVSRYIRSGQLPGRRVAGRYFIEEAALAGFEPRPVGNPVWRNRLG